MAAPPSPPGTRSRPRPRWPRPSPSTAASCAPTPRPARTRFAIVQAEDELAAIGMVHRRRLERGAGLHRHLRPRHLADAGVHRPRLLRRDAGGDLRRPARRAVDRHADAHAAVRHPALPPTPGTATPSTSCCSPRTRASASSSRAQAFDLADRLQTPVFVMLDLDIGMNEWLCEPLAWDDAPALRPRQGDDRRRARGGPRVRPLSRRRRRRHPLPHLARHASDARAPSSPAAPRSDRYARYTEEGAAYVDNMQRLLRKFETAKRLVPEPVQRARAASRPASALIYFGSTAPAMDEALDGARAPRASISTRCASAPSRSPKRWSTSSPTHDQVFIVEQNRDAQLRTLLVNECGARSGAPHLGAAL